MIPEVEKIRVLGLLFEKQATQKQATRLVKRVANRKAGMREDSLLRFVHSFAMSHVAYVSALHNWRLDERNQINSMIRKAHKTALGLLDCTSTEKILDLGVHNTLEEIREAQIAAQLERIAAT